MTFSRGALRSTAASSWASTSRTGDLRASERVRRSHGRPGSTGHGPDALPGNPESTTGCAATGRLLRGTFLWTAAPVRRDLPAPEHDRRAARRRPTLGYLGSMIQRARVPEANGPVHGAHQTAALDETRPMGRMTSSVQLRVLLRLRSADCPSPFCRAGSPAGRELATKALSSLQSVSVRATGHGCAGARYRGVGTITQDSEGWLPTHAFSNCSRTSNGDAGWLGKDSRCAVYGLAWRSALAISGGQEASSAMVDVQANIKTVGSSADYTLLRTTMKKLRAELGEPVA